MTARRFQDGIAARLHGIVPLPSALGRGGRGTPALFARDAQWVSYETGHLELLARPAAYAQLRRWLGG